MCKKITDWNRILGIMTLHNRKEGYIDQIDGRTYFFDSDPEIDGIGACHVTIEEVRKYSNEQTN